MDHLAIFPANLFVTPKERLTQSIWAIQEELENRKQQFIDEKRFFSKIYKQEPISLNVKHEKNY